MTYNRLILFLQREPECSDDTLVSEKELLLKIKKIIRKNKIFFIKTKLN